MRSRRPVLVLVGVVAVGLVIGVLVLRSRDRVIGGVFTRPGGVVVVTEDGEGLRYGAVGGTGLGGTVGLVGGRCLGFEDAKDPLVVVWPPGTRFTGAGLHLVVHLTDGRDLRLGDLFTGGTAQQSYPALRRQLPAACRGARLMDVTLHG